MRTALAVLLTGVGATAFTDAWSLLRRQAFGVPAPNYGFVGRWIAHMREGRFRHDSIAAARPVAGEGAIGWTAHYLIGIAFAGLLLALAGAGWFAAPRIGPALLVGAVTVLAPYFVLQPGMGAGLAARRTPRPWTARFHSLVMHLVFGLGLYASARLLLTLA